MMLINNANIFNKLFKYDRYDIDMIYDGDMALYDIQYMNDMI